MGLFLSILGIGFLVGGSVWIVRAYRYIQTAVRSVHWPTARATIRHSGITYSDYSYLPNIEYAYEINGHSYVGNRVNIGLPFAASKSW